MKRLFYISIGLFPLLAQAQNFPQMNEQQMQEMMATAKEMEACMKKVDQQELKELEQEATEMEKETRALCAAGKKDEAQQKAMAFGMQAAKNPAMQEMAKCGEMMQGFMPAIPGMVKPDEEQSGQYHICDY